MSKRSELFGCSSYAHMLMVKLRFNFRDKKKCSHMLQAGLTNIAVLGD